MIWALLKMVPTSVWVGIAAGLAVIAALWAVDHNGYQRGTAAVQVKWDQERVAYAEALQKEKDRQATVVERVVVEYRDRVKVIKEKGDAIVTAIPYFVRSSCVLPGGWRVLHDSAASGDLPADPDGAIAAAEPAESLAALETVAANYATCHATAARLAALQQLVKGLQ